MTLALSLTLRSELPELARLAGEVESFCERAGVAMKDALSLQLVLEEAATNIIRHGYRENATQTFTVDLNAEATTITAVITDRAPAYNPLARAEPDTNTPLEKRSIGGLGVHLVRKIAGRVAYERRDDCNVLTIVLNRTRSL